jgi:predicted lipoprotein with Yx(FWY)xxD motif
MFLTGDVVVWAGGAVMAVTAVALTVKLNILFGALGVAVALMASTSLAVEMDRRRPRHRTLLFVGRGVSLYRFRAMLVALSLVASVVFASAVFAFERVF